MNDRIPVYGSLLEADDRAAVDEGMSRGWLGMGNDTGRFEAAVQSVLDDQHHVIALSTGSAALHVALLVAGIGPGDEVIVPSLCHLSNVQAVLATGAEPVLCDVLDDTLCMDPSSVEALLSPRTKAVMPLDYGSSLYDAPALARAIEGRNIRVVHDAAHSFGSSVRGAPVGTQSDLCIFSFDPVKVLTAIDAGILVVRTEQELRAARELRLLGSDQPSGVMYLNSRTWDYDAVRVGFRYHLSNIHGCLGANQITKLDRVRANRQAACRRYVDRLKGTDPVDLVSTEFDDLCPFLFAIRVPADSRDALRAALTEQGIDTGIHWRPAHEHTHFQGLRQGPVPVSAAAGRELVSLPLHSSPMADSTIDRVSEAILKFYR
ncbi:MAG: Cell wall aminitransferase [Acidimicrobiia bacterium]|nr:Cell wall aminitransferase [Acidimicrobiia bacterium]